MKVNTPTSILTTLLLLFLGSCATNPVTGQRELSLVSEQQELAIGEQQYAPLRQSQGGDYVADPEIAAYINEVGQRLAQVSDRKLPYEFKVLNNSVPNAWALPGGKISVNRGLLIALKSEAELAAVLGHEIVHAAAKHGARAMSKGMLMQGALAGTAVFSQGSKYGDLTQMGAGIGAQLISTKYGRDNERESDHFGMIYMARAGYHPQGAVDLQRTFVAMSAGQKQDWLTGMLASHPASEERVKNNLAMLNTLPDTGEKGSARYQEKTRRLQQTKPAYEAYESGRAALAKGDVKTAENKAKQALAIEPKEALFYGLLADVALQRSSYAQANISLDKAIALNPNFFYFYLQRGQSFLSLNNRQKAEQDLRKSVELLPTAGAYLGLGKISQSAGRMDEAKAYFAKIAGTDNDTAKAAYIALLEMDLQANPHAYLQVALKLAANGTVIAEVSNPTPVNITGISLGLIFENQHGQRRINHALDGVVQAQSKQAFVLSGIEPQNPNAQPSLKAGIIAAQIAP